MFAVIHYKTLILLGVNIIPQVVLLIHIPLVPSLSLPCLPPLVENLDSYFPNVLGTFEPDSVCAVYSAMQRHAASFPKLCIPFLLVSHCPSPSFCQMLPHSGPDLRIFCLICIPQLLFDLSSAIFSLLPLLVLI